MTRAKSQKTEETASVDKRNLINRLPDELLLRVRACRASSESSRPNALLPPAALRCYFLASHFRDDLRLHRHVWVDRGLAPAIGTGKSKDAEVPNALAASGNTVKIFTCASTYGRTGVIGSASAIVYRLDSQLLEARDLLALQRLRTVSRARLAVLQGFDPYIRFSVADPGE